MSFYTSMRSTERNEITVNTAIISRYKTFCCRRDIIISEVRRILLIGTSQPFLSALRNLLCRHFAAFFAGASQISTHQIEQYYKACFRLKVNPLMSSSAELSWSLVMRDQRSTPNDDDIRNCRTVTIANIPC